MADPNTNSALFHKHMVTAQDQDFIAAYCELTVDQDGTFFYIDGHDASVMLTLPCAVKLYEALGKAIQVANAKRQNGMKKV